MDILKLRDTITALIDTIKIKGDLPEDYYCVNSEYAKYKHSELFYVRFQSEREVTTVRFDKTFGAISARIWHECGDMASSSIDGAIFEIKNCFKKMGVDFNYE